MLRKDWFKPGGALGGALFEDWQRSQPEGFSEVPACGQRIGAFVVKRPIGEGGMGAVYLAERVGEFEQRVALKLIKRRSRGDDVERLFKRERQLLARLNHAGIARLIDGGQTDDGQHWFAMEWIDGATLDAWLKHSAPDLAARIDVFARIALNVAAAHEQLVIHGDIKPSNILIDAKGQPFLLDFGIARALDALDADEPTAMTPTIASPEQAAGSALTVRSDVFQLGRLLARMIDALPAPLAAIAAKAQSEDPAQRYPDVRALIDDVRAWQAHRPIAALPQSWWTRSRLFVRRHGFATGAITVAAMLLLGATALYVFHIDAARKEAQGSLATARATMDFLTGLLGRADPRRGAGREATVESVLIAASEEVKASAMPSDQRARLSAVLGEIFTQREDNHRAIPLLRQALENPSLQPLERVRLLRMLARSLVTPKALDEANALLAQAYVLLDNSRAAREERTHLDRIRALMMYFGSDLPAAIALQQQALGDAETLFGADAEELVTHLTNLGQFLGVGGDVPAGIAVLERGYALSLKHYGADNTRTINLGGALAQSLGFQKEFARAAKLLDDTLAATLRVFGEGSPNHALMLMAKADLSERRGDCAAAVPQYRAALDVWNAMPRANDLNSVSTLQGMGDCLMKLQDYPNALAAYEEMLRRDRSGQHASDINIGNRELKVAQALAALGQCALARKYADEADTLAQKMAPNRKWLHEQIAAVRSCGSTAPPA